MISIPNALLIDRVSSMFEDDVIPPVGFEYSPWRDYDMIVWKKALKVELKRHSSMFNPEFYEPVIVKLKIPKDASVLFTPTKCRANRAIVLGFYPCGLGGEEYELDMTTAMSWYDHSFKYNLGEEITPDCFDRNWRKTCSHGIHFFRYFVDAVRYIF